MPVLTNVNKVYLSLYFCKDVASASEGHKLLHDLVAAFPSLRWSFVTDDGWCDRHPEFLQEGADENEVPERIVDQDEFIQSEWPMQKAASDLVYVESDDREVSASVWVPPAGGISLGRNCRGQSYINPGHINIHISKEVFAGPLVMETVEAIARLGLRVQASYGYIMSSDQGIPWRLDRQLAGVFWVTFFGTDYVEMIGPRKFETVPCYSAERLADGSYVVIATRDLEESLTAGGLWRRTRIAAHLGLKWFFPRPFAKKWYPKLRNLSVKPTK